MRKVFARDYGIYPSTGQDCTGRVREMLSEHHANAEFVFEPGVYFFDYRNANEADYHISNTYYQNPRKLSVVIQNMKNIIFDGNGCTFQFNGSCTPIAIDESTGITIKNIAFDWDIPLSAEGEIVRVGENYFDMKIDAARFPYKIKENRLYFYGDDWESRYGGISVFDERTRRIAYRLGDAIVSGRQESTEEGNVRFFCEMFHAPKIGNLAVLRHSRRLHPGIFANHSENLCFHELKLYNTGGLGILAQFCRNIEARRVSFTPNAEKGRRLVSGHDDGLHFVNTRGKIRIEDCSFYGLMDDPVNIHGISADVVGKPERNKLKCAYRTEQSVGFLNWAEIGDEVRILEKSTLFPVQTGKLKRYELLSEREFLLEFEEPLLLESGEAYAVENITATADVTCRNNYFGSCRARGLLVSTKGKVRIENNFFASSGSAILLAGDANQWYESGACEDIRIENNVFDCCLTSVYQFCEAVISICPEIPEPELSKPFHKSIAVCKNTFHVFDAPVLYAYSVENLDFSQNRIMRSCEYEPYHERKDMLTLRYCRKVKAAENHLTGDVPDRIIALENCDAVDLGKGAIDA